MAFVGKFAVAACFSILYTYSAELYPTCVRSSALGLNSSMARVGGALSPLLFGLDSQLPWFSNTVFGCLAFIGTIVTLNSTSTQVKATVTALFMPETLGMPMSQTMEEAEENYYKTPEQVHNETQKNEAFESEEL